MNHSPAFLKIVTESKAQITEFSVSEVAAMLEAGTGLTLIDVREDREWNSGHIKNAIHIGKGVIERDIEQTVADKNALLILYCGGGFRSALATDNLRKMGYQQAASMDGGWKGWREAGLPIEL